MNDGCDWVTVGQLRGSFGVKGWVHISSFTKPQERILEFSAWWLGEDTQDSRHGSHSNLRKVECLSGKKHQRGVVARLQGVDSLEMARELSGLVVCVPRHQLPEPEEGAHYWADMLGLQVVTKNGKVLGIVEQLFATGANDVLVVREQDGGERLLPFTHEVIQDVNTSTRTITVCLMPGM